MMGLTTIDDSQFNKANGLVYHARLGVDFTSKGDRAVVQYNFFKLTVGLHGLEELETNA